MAYAIYDVVVYDYVIFHICFVYGKAIYDVVIYVSYIALFNTYIII